MAAEERKREGGKEGRKERKREGGECLGNTNTNIINAHPHSQNISYSEKKSSWNKGTDLIIDIRKFL